MSQIQAPKHWTVKKIFEIADVGQGGTPSRSKPEYWGGNIPWLRSGEILNNRITDSKEKITELGLKNSSTQLCPKGTILMAMTGQGLTRGRTALLDIDACANQSCAHIINKSEKVLTEFLWVYLQSRYWFIRSIHHGSGQPGINTTLIKQLEVPIPPTKEEQKRILQKINCILTELEEKNKAILELQTSKIKHLEILSDKTIGNIISKLMHLYSPPDSWNIQKLETICHDIQPGFAEGKKDVKDGVIHLRMNNIGTNFELNFGLIRTIEANKDRLKKYQLKQGDVIFNNTNSSRLVGKSVIFNDSKVCLYSNHLTRLRVKKEIVLPEWLLFYLRARWLNGDFERMCNKWINQAAVNNNKIRNLEIPVPKLEIQKKIIDSLSNISKNIEAIRIISESILKQEKINLNHFENLSSKILDVAFSGKLVN